MWLAAGNDCSNIQLLILKKGGTLVPVHTGDSLSSLPSVAMGDMSYLVFGSTGMFFVGAPCTDMSGTTFNPFSPLGLCSLLLLLWSWHSLPCGGESDNGVHGFLLRSKISGK